MAKYYLRKRTLGSPGRVDLNESEYHEIFQARNNLLLALYVEENFDLLLSNYLDFETTLLELAAERSVRPSPKYSGFQADRRLINRRLINLLTACKTYTSQTKIHISKIFGHHSNAANDTKFLFDSERTNYLGYRIMEYLRGYSQHRGWPIHKIIPESRWVDNMSHLRYVFTPLLLTKFLKEDEEYLRNDEDKKVLKEIQRLGDEIDLRPLVRQYVQGLVEVHCKIRELLSLKIIAWEQTIRCAIKQFQDKCPEETPLGLALYVKNDTENNYIEIFEDLLEYRRQLQVENPAITNLPASYISNENDNIDEKIK